MQESQKKIAYILFIIPVIVAIGAIAFHYLEKWDWLDSVYFAVTTLSTVGYGDLHPTTSATKIFVIFYILIGVAIMLYGLSILGQYWVEKRNESLQKNFKSMRALGAKAVSKFPRPPTDY